MIETTRIDTAISEAGKENDSDGVIFDGIVNNQIIKLSCKMESDAQLGLVESLHFC